MSCVDESEQPLLAADISRHTQIRLYDVAASLLAPELRRRIVLLTVALSSWWEHVS
ncbi:hypothetical protein [Nannocystis sp. SCPEA4]|uniref:hypothetical protein n=1 Tax=Nannocystis sp. SCPEA4 TaxID=2996787 RepID=UPI00226D5950|nr:hypothetical protein [Nannocystis sp. SCPEA4]MCY1062692.1 hypothetical protein [Nannocystis sp. SCPEA4]